MSFLLNRVKMIFRLFSTENKMKRERTDGESAKAVREQVLLLRCKSEPGIVKSAVSKSSYAADIAAPVLKILFS